MRSLYMLDLEPGDMTLIADILEAAANFVEARRASWVSDDAEERTPAMTSAVRRLLAAVDAAGGPG